MSNSFYLTEENLIGSIGNALLQLKKVKDRKLKTVDNDFFIKLIDFFEIANDENKYQSLLFDKYFIISESFLDNIHQEFKQKDNLSNLDFSILKDSLKVLSTDNIAVDTLRDKLKEIVLVLLQIRNNRQLHLQ
jgi:hypothetical protein